MEVKRITVSELIKKLEEIKEEHGDIPITFKPDHAYYDFHYVEDVYVVVWDEPYYKKPFKTVFLSTDN